MGGVAKSCGRMYYVETKSWVCEQLYCSRWRKVERSGLSDVSGRVCKGYAAISPVGGELAVCMYCCRSVKHCLGCKRESYSMHLAFMSATREAKRCWIAQLLFEVWSFCSPTATGALWLFEQVLCCFCFQFRVLLALGWHNTAVVCYSGP